MNNAKINAIVSGGQSGADIAALDWAIANGIPHGGWCPKGRRCESGVIPMSYDLIESDRYDYRDRTRLNVRDSDATLVLTVASKVTGGSRFTAECARILGKPYLHVSARDAAPGRLISDFVKAHGVRVLNVAGSRASKEPGIYAMVQEALDAANLTKANDIAAAPLAFPSRRLGAVQSGELQQNEGTEYDYHVEKQGNVQVAQIRR